MINICNSFKTTFLAQQLLKDRQLLQEMLIAASVKATLSLPSPAPHKKPLKVKAHTEVVLSPERTEAAGQAVVVKHHDPVQEATRQVLQ